MGAASTFGKIRKLRKVGGMVAGTGKGKGKNPDLPDPTDFKDKEERQESRQGRRADRQGSRRKKVGL